MATRTQQDTFIDDSDEQCPLCVEEFDLSDKNFRPCPCGYQVCQFCFNNIRTNMNGLCPACRRPYDDKTIEFKTVSPEEFKADMALKARKTAVAKQKEAEKRQNETLNRKNLAGLRVVQKNLVYVVGLNPRTREEELLRTLRGHEYFGQYGKIIKIVVSKAKEGANSNSIGVYVTFARKEDAATCIAAVDGSPNGDRVLRAQYGTTKYCSAFLRNEQCNNRSCMFLHETGEDSDSFSRQDLSSLNATQRPSQSGASGPSQPSAPPQQAPQAVAVASQAMNPQGSREEGSRTGSTDASALPSSASWANKDTNSNVNRRTSVPVSRSSPSPRTGNATVSTQKPDEATREEVASTRSKETALTAPSQASESAPSQSSSRKSSIDRIDPTVSLLNKLLEAISSPDFVFSFSDSDLSHDEAESFANHPCMIDPYGGVKKRVKREKEEASRKKEEEERATQEAEAQNIHQATAMVEDENLEGGSLQLGGEPEERHDPRSASGRLSEPQSAIQPPSQNSLVGSPLGLNQNFSNLNINGRSLTPQQLMLLKNNNQSAGVMDQFQPFGETAFDQGDSSRSSLFQHQMPHANAHGHARQASRFSFANDSNVKNNGARHLTHQPAMIQGSNPLSATTQQNPLGNHLYSSGVQHPPPGLKNAGTPPISGGGMFGQGHGFTSASNPLGLGNNFNTKDSNANLMREFQQGRGNVGGLGIGQSHDASKREYKFPSYRTFSPSPTQAPALGLLGSFQGAQYHELGPLKQKKKGKKHRHANTSSFGGGVVDLADPSMSRARMHQAGAGAGQGLYGGQGQVDIEFPPLAPPPKPPVSRMRDVYGTAPHGGRSTPPVPPGFSLPHAHPSPGSVGDSRPTSRSTTPAQNKKVITPAIPFVAGAPPPMANAKAAKESEKDSKRDSQKGSSDASDIQRVVADPSSVSLGSPKGKLASSRETAHLEMTMHASQGQTKSEDPLTLTTADSRKVEEPHSRPLPGKLDIAAVLAKEDRTQQVSSPSNVEETKDASSGAPTSTPISRPDTPATGASPVPRQPRTIRVLPTPKGEVAPSMTPSVTSAPSPASQIIAPSSIMPKQRSRQPSLASMSGPATPVCEAASDNMSTTSASASRPGSPPLSKVGSASLRQISKSQAKKERQAKAKEEAKKAEELAKSTADDIMQAPIIGRQKKKKKPLTGTTDDSTPNASRPTSPHPRDFENHTASEAEAAPKTTSLGKGKGKEDSKVKQGPKSKMSPPPTDTTEDTSIQLKSVSQLIQEMIDDGEILRDHPFFKTPLPLSHRYDIGSGDYEAAQATANTNLTEDQKQDLRKGRPVRIRNTDDRQIARILITPKGTVYRGFSDEEEERVLRLEKSIAETPAAEAFHPTLGASRMASSTLPPSLFPPSSTSYSTSFSLTALGYSSSMPPSMETDATPNLSLGFQEERAPIFTPEMTDDEVNKKMDEITAVWETSKKETEALEKRLNGLIKKNRRLGGL